MHACFQLVAFVREHIWHKALLMGYSMRLELTRVCSVNDFQLVMDLYRSLPVFFLECVYLILFSPLLYLICFVIVCVCWGGLGFHKQSIFLVCVCVPHIHTHTKKWIYIWGLRGIIVVVENGWVERSSNSGRESRHFAERLKFSR